MRYFDYQCNDKMGTIWGMFKDLASIPEVDRDPNEFGRCLYDHTLDIVKSFSNKIERGVDLNNEDFCLRAYELKCQQRDHIQRLKDADDVLAIVEDSDVDEEKGVGYGEISSRNLKSYEELYDAIDDLDAFERYLNALYDINKTYITERGVNIVVLLKSSLKGIPMAVERLQKILKEDTLVKDLVINLCETSSDNLLKYLEASIA